MKTGHFFNFSTALFLILFGADAWSALRCQLAHHRHPEIFERAVHIPEWSHSYQERRNRVQQLSPNEKLIEIDRYLNAVGVKAEILDVSYRIPRWLKKKAVLILPEKDGAFLNHLAYRMKKNFGTDLIYSDLLGEATAGYHPVFNQIMISEFSALTGLADFPLLHEARHAAMSFKEKKGEHALANGFSTKLSWTRYPWRNHKIPLYENRIDTQELETYGHDLIYEMNDLFRRAQTHQFKELGALLTPAFIFEEIISTSNVLINRVRGAPQKTVFQDKKTGQTKISLHSWNYFLYHVIPSDFMPDQPSQARAFAYLEALIARAKENLKKIDDFDRLGYIVDESMKTEDEFTLANRQLLSGARNANEALSLIPALESNLEKSKTLNEKKP